MRIGNQRTTIGNIRFISDSNTDGINSTIIIVTAVISIAISILILLVILAIVKCLKTRAHCCSSPSDKEKPFINEAVSMYASPAYGTHQVFAEPGLDHLYECTEDKMTTTLKDTARAADDEIDADACGYLKFKSNCEVANQALIEDSNTQLVGTINNPELGLKQEREIHTVPFSSYDIPQVGDPQEAKLTIMEIKCLYH